MTASAHAEACYGPGKSPKDTQTPTGSMASLNPRNTGVYSEMAEKSSTFYSQDMQITFNISLRIYLEREKATAK